MAKIDYTKVEEMLATALHSMLIKKLVEGRSTVSTQAVRYYGLDDGPRPKKDDSVISALKELEVDAKQEAFRAKLEAERQERERRIALGEQVEPIKTEPTEEKPAEPSTIAASQVIQREKILTSDETPPTISALFLLQQHLQWFKKRKIKNVLAALKTTEDEITALAKEKPLNEASKKRVDELLGKAKDLKAGIIKKLGLEDDTAFIEKERKKHITKRFNIKETWLPLDTH